MRRFSFMKDPALWDGDLVEDPEGGWVRWPDVAPYIPKDHMEEKPLVPTLKEPRPVEDLPYTSEEYAQAFEDSNDIIDELNGYSSLDTYEFMRRNKYGYEADES